MFNVQLQSNKKITDIRTSYYSIAIIIIIHQSYSIFQDTQRCFTMNALFIYLQIHTLVVVNYMCSHSCPGACCRKCGCQYAPPALLCIFQSHRTQWNVIPILFISPITMLCACVSHVIEIIFLYLSGCRLVRHLCVARKILSRCRLAIANKGWTRPMWSRLEIVTDLQISRSLTQCPPLVISHNNDSYRLPFQPFFCGWKLTSLLS